MAIDPCILSEYLEGRCIKEAIFKNNKLILTMQDDRKVIIIANEIKAKIKNTDGSWMKTSELTRWNLDTAKLLQRISKLFPTKYNKTMCGNCQALQKLK